VFQTAPISANLRLPAALRQLAASVLIGISLISLASFPLRAQNSSKAAKAGRKLVRKVEPVYPQDLKRLNIGGTVKLDVQISARGSVEKVEIVGGNPILADSAARAVKQWQYEPADGSSSILLNVEFNPRR